MKRIFCIAAVCTVCLSFLSGGRVFALENKEIQVSAKACVLIEEKTGRVIFEKNSLEKLPMASTTKIMTTLLCLESGNLDDEFIVDKDAVKVEGSSMGLVEGDVVTKRALCYGMLLPSGNDAANAAAVKIAGSIDNFAKMMNKRAKSIGMAHTFFVTPSGLEGEGHGASAYDMALLAGEALKNPDFCEICSQSSAKVHFGNPPYDRWLKNTNKLLTMYEGVKGVKTGFTDQAGRCLVSACERQGVSLICVTLNDKDDWNDHMKMYDMGFDEVKEESLTCDEFFEISVAGGVCDTVKGAAEGQISIGSCGDDKSHITYKLSALPFVYAPVKAGDKIASLEWYYDDRLIGSLPVAATENIPFYNEEEEKTLWERIKDFLFN